MVLRLTVLVNRDCSTTTLLRKLLTVRAKKCTNSLLASKDKYYRLYREYFVFPNNLDAYWLLKAIPLNDTHTIYEIVRVLEV